MDGAGDATQTRAERIRALGDTAKKEAAAKKQLEAWKHAVREVAATPPTTAPTPPVIPPSPLAGE